MQKDNISEYGQYENQNSMNYSVNNINSHIFGRSEGKIKSYKSCTDLRAWSHDEKARDRYLRDWMRSDMPVYIISVRTLVTLLKIMTCKTSGRVSRNYNRSTWKGILVAYVGE